MIKLYNGLEVPNLAFGSWGLNEGEETIKSIFFALKCGFSHIDTAQVYNNEKGVGIAIKEFIDGGGRKPFLTTKIPNKNFGYNSTLCTFKESVKKLNTPIDLFLIHDPARKSDDWKRLVIDTWSAMEKLYREGYVKAIGISNFSIHHIEYLLSNAEIKPMINQIEIHPEHQNKEVVDFCLKNDIQISSWGALNQGRIFKKPLFKELGAKYNKTASQIAIRWNIQKGYIPIVRSSKKEHIIDNYNVWDFSISNEDMAYLDSLDGGEYSRWHRDDVHPPEMIALSKLPEMLNFKPTTEKYYLFNFLPYLTKKNYKDKVKYYLFGFIPVLKIKRK